MAASFVTTVRSSMASPTRRLVLLAAVLVIAAAGYYGDASRAVRLTPPGQPPLVSLARQNLSSFAATFDSARAVPRILLFLSPT